jgi:hypothetical protein
MGWNVSVYTYPWSIINTTSMPLRRSLGSSASNYVKSGFSDPVDFATNWSLIDCRMPKLCQGSGSGQKDLDPNGQGSVSQVYGPIKHVFLHKNHVKSKFVVHCGNLRKVVLNLPSSTMVPKKFDYTKLWQFRHYTRWCVLAVHAMDVRSLAYRSRHSAICQWIRSRA